jgi:imidazolonepropionase-like amidohydrolase
MAHIWGLEYLKMGIEAGIDHATHMEPEPLPQDLVARMIKQNAVYSPTLVACDWKSLRAENLRRYVRAGGAVALGDDYGNPGTMLGMPVNEMECMENAGMGRMQIIVAGTKNAALVCGKERDLGTLEAGKLADVLVVDGDPTLDIHALLKTRLVLRDGIVIFSKTVSQM